MSCHAGPDIVDDGLVLYLDAANERSYPGSGTTWYDLSGNNNDFTLYQSSVMVDGYYNLSINLYAYNNSAITNTTSGSLVITMYTTEVQALFLSGGRGASKYIGAYRVGNKEYYSSAGSTGLEEFYIDLVDKSNIYDYISDGNWHMIEFKNYDFTGWSSFYFNGYPAYDFSNGKAQCVMIYDKILSAAESRKNYNALKGRYGL